MAKDNKSGKWVAGAAIAGIAGFVAGILTAPKSGKETREDIKTGAVKAKTEAEKKLKEIYSELNTLIDQAQEKGKELSGKAKQEFDEVYKKAVDAKDKVRTIISSLHEGDADDPDLKKALAESKAALTSLQKYMKSSK